MDFEASVDVGDLVGDDVVAERVSDVESVGLAVTGLGCC